MEFSIKRRWVKTVCIFKNDFYDLKKRMVQGMGGWKIFFFKTFSTLDDKYEMTVIEADI